MRLVVLSILALMMSAGIVRAANDASGAPVTLGDFALPEYNRDNRIQFILYGKKAMNIGALIELDTPILDVVDDKIKNVNDIVPLDKAQPYPLGSKREDIDKFWSGKKHCRALMSSESATFDKAARMLHGDTNVYFRSREMDIDGVGFDADYEKKTVHIRSKVRVVLRPDAVEGFGKDKTSDDAAPSKKTK